MDPCLGTAVKAGRDVLFPAHPVARERERDSVLPSDALEEIRCPHRKPGCPIRRDS